MKIAEAKKVIYEGVKPKGFRVTFEHLDGRILTSDHFPERDEPLIEHEDEAWEMASKFATATVGKCLHIYVIDDRWMPVPNYRERMIENRSHGQSEDRK